MKDRKAEQRHAKRRELHKKWKELRRAARETVRERCKAQRETYRTERHALLAQYHAQKKECKHQEANEWQQRKAQLKEQLEALRRTQREKKLARRAWRREYKTLHHQYHHAFKNRHWELLHTTRHDKQAKLEWRREAKAFRRAHGMLRYPLMADIFDLVEELRAEPNSRTPFSREIRVERDVVYSVVEGEELHLDLYFPLSPMPNAPAVMVIPGGGWMIHNRARRDGYARLYARMGAVVAVIDHRLCPEVAFPANLQDCVCAYNYLVEHSADYGIDSHNITITGDSSGGHLAACLGCVASSVEYRERLELPSLATKPYALIMISGAFSFEVMYRIPLTHTLMVRYVTAHPSRKAYRRWRYYRESIPYNYVNTEFPPSYNSGGMMDFLCFGEARRFGAALTRAGVDNDFHVGTNITCCDHCYVLRLPFAAARKDMFALLAWYCQKEQSNGVDMSEGFQDVEDFLINYPLRVRSMEEGETK